MQIAITREVSTAIADCELSFLPRQPIDIERAREQHRDYEARLARAGWEVRSLPGDPALPDSVFVEDTAVVLDELAILGRPGVESRRGELIAVEEALQTLRPLAHIERQAMLDGGDVLRVGRRLYVGLSRRTNREVVAQIRRLTAPLGYDVIAVSVGDCLHLKSAVTAVGPQSLLINRGWIDDDVFSEFELIDVDPAEPFAANALLLDDVVLVSSAFPRTRERLEKRSVRTDAIDLSELAKAEGGLTCCSLLVG